MTDKLTRNIDIFIKHANLVKDNTNTEYLYSLDAYGSFLEHSTKFIELLHKFEECINEVEEIKKEMQDGR